MVQIGRSWQHGRRNHKRSIRMNSLPLPAFVAAFAAALALPFSAAAAGTLLFTAGLGAIMHADYPLRRRRVRLPRRAIVVPAAAAPCSLLCCEPNRLAA
jgi:hypothetical protein